MKAIAFAVIGLLLAFCANAEDRDSPRPHPLEVQNGSGDGDHVHGEVVTITAESPESGAVFLMWDSLGDKRIQIKNRLSASTTLEMPGYAANVAAVFGKLKVWFPPGAETGKKGLLFPKNPDAASQPRSEIRVRLTFISGEAEGVNLDDIWKRLIVTADWFPVSASQGKWHSSEIARFYSQKTGGDEFNKGGGLQHSYFSKKDDDEKVLETSIWCEGVWETSQVTKDRPAPKLDYKSDLKVKPSASSGYLRTSAGGSLLPVEFKDLKGPGVRTM